jgi:hypothetical protein
MNYIIKVSSGTIMFTLLSVLLINIIGVFISILTIKISDDVISYTLLFLNSSLVPVNLYTVYSFIKNHRSNKCVE